MSNRELRELLGHDFDDDDDVRDTMFGGDEDAMDDYVEDALERY